MQEIRKQSEVKISGEHIFLKKFQFPLILVFLVAFFNQLSGINAFLYYAPRIFEAAGLAASTALFSSIGIGIVNLIFTLLGVFLIDRLGRRKLLFIGSIGYIISLSLVCGIVFPKLGWIDSSNFSTPVRSIEIIVILNFKYILFILNCHQGFGVRIGQRNMV